MFYFQPLEQFEIIIYSPFFLEILNFFFKFSFVFYLTNTIIYFSIVIFVFYLFFCISLLNLKLILNNNWVIFIELYYLTIKDMIIKGVNHLVYSKRYFVLYVTVFTYILISNMVGLTPYAYTITSLVIQNFLISCSFLIGVTLIGIKRNSFGFYKLFIPKGVPQKLIPFIAFIEVVSYISRAFSLAIRLFANMMSGHTLLNILASFTFKISKESLIVGFLPVLLVLIVCFLEFGIALLQAYVFLVLMIIYLHDTLHIGSH